MTATAFWNLTGSLAINISTFTILPARKVHVTAQKGGPGQHEQCHIITPVQRMSQQAYRSSQHQHGCEPHNTGHGNCKLRLFRISKTFHSSSTFH